MHAWALLLDVQLVCAKRYITLFRGQVRTDMSLGIFGVR
jgi:hypothetical protein